MISKPFRLVWLSLALVSASTPALALDVILDTGEGQPTAPYLERIEQEPDSDQAPPRPPVNDALTHMLPVEPSRLRVAPLRGEPSTEVLERLQHLPRPLCLVGSDEQSMNWLAHHREALRQAGAVCMLVQAGTRKDLERVRDVARDIPVQVAHGDDLAARLQLEVYPVLISRDGIEQ